MVASFDLRVHLRHAIPGQVNPGSVDAPHLVQGKGCSAPALARRREANGFEPRCLGGSFLEEALARANDLVIRFLGKQAKQPERAVTRGNLPIYYGPFLGPTILEVQIPKQIQAYTVAEAYIIIFMTICGIATFRSQLMQALQTWLLKNNLNVRS